MTTHPHCSTPANHEVGQQLTIKEAAALLRIADSTIRRHIRTGRLPSFQISPKGKRLIPVRAIQALLSETPQVADTRAVADHIRGQYQA